MTTISVVAGTDAATPERSKGLGAVYTRRWAAEMVLNLGGYVADADLAGGRAIEPSCGAGAFIQPMIERLAQSCDARGHDLRDTGAAICAWDTDPRAVAHARSAARRVLCGHGLDERHADRLSSDWIREGDFLLADHLPADWVVGNPPYVRLEDIPASRKNLYRKRWNQMTGRADIYIGFFQAGLEALRPEGTLSYLCADRWMTTQYGGPLRRMIEDRFAVQSIVTLHDADVFETRVNAYPAAIAIGATEQGPSLRVETTRHVDVPDALAVADLYSAGPAGSVLTDRGAADDGKPTTFAAAWTTPKPSGGTGWLVGEPSKIDLVQRLEAQFPALADPESGVHVGIGLTTGADTVYLTADPHAVEDDRLLPMVTAADLNGPSVSWAGTHLINPWDRDAKLVDLARFPELAAHFGKHELRMRARHIAKRDPSRWYRTIDRPLPGLASTPKLLVADLRSRVAPALDDGFYYPHHNLCWITSTVWDLEVLGGLLMSDYGSLFLETYSPRVAGGTLRVTAQYLRRIRVPKPDDLDSDTADCLVEAFRSGDLERANDASDRAYRTER